MTSTTTTREGKKWSVNETLRLQREYELLELDVSTISVLHSRSERAILFRLKKEGFVDEFENARGYTEESLQLQKEEPVTDPRIEFSSYIDTILEQKLLNVEEIQQTVSEALEAYRKKNKSTKSLKKTSGKRVLRQYNS